METTITGNRDTTTAGIARTKVGTEVEGSAVVVEEDHVRFHNPRIVTTITYLL